MPNPTNKVKFNLKNVYYAKKTDSGFATPVALPGAVSLSLSPEGEKNVFYADGMEYYVSYENGGYTGTLTIAKITDAFRKDILMETADTNNVLVEETNKELATFALGFEIDGDKSSTKFWYYNCTVQRPSSEANTVENSRTPDTDSLELTVTQMADGKVRAKTTEDTTASVLEGWFSAVYTGPTPGSNPNPDLDPDPEGDPEGGE